MGHEAGPGGRLEHPLEVAGVVGVVVGEPHPPQVAGVDDGGEGVHEPVALDGQPRVHEHGLGGPQDVGVHGQDAGAGDGDAGGQDGDVAVSPLVGRVHHRARGVAGIVGVSMVTYLLGIGSWASGPVRLVRSGSMPQRRSSPACPVQSGMNDHRTPGSSPGS